MESEHARVQDGRGQGDIVALDHAAGERGPGLGVIINADCDLAHRKIDGTIAYLPVYTFREYLEQFWLPGHLAVVAREATDRVVALTDAGENGAEDLAIMLGRFGEEEATKRLCGLPGVNRKATAELAGHVKRILIAGDASKPVYERFGGLCDLAKDPKRHARAHVERALKEMREGHLFLSEIAGRQDIGFVIRMQRIYSMAEDRVFTSVSAQRSGSDGSATTAVRVARLTPRYRYKVLQMFAQQFSRIGLDDEVTALSSLAIDDLLAGIGAA